MSDRIEEYRRDWCADGESYPEARGRAKVSTHRTPGESIGKAFFFALCVSVIYGLVTNRNELSRWIDNQVNRLKTQTEMSAVSRLLQQHHRVTGTVPADFKEYLNGNMKKTKPSGASTDFWGTGYLISSADKTLTIISAGQDRKFGTRDDLVLQAQLASP
jgi:hypothetical protein